MLTNLTTIQRNSLLIRITGVFWIAAKLIGWKVWMADRLFPLVPLFHFLVAPQAVHVGLFIASLIGMLLLLIKPSNSKLQICIVVLEVLACSLDQNRWELWEYQYIFVLLIFIINKKNEFSAANIFRFMLATIYIYSGLSKINSNFSLYMGYKAMMMHLPTRFPALDLFIVFFHGSYLIGLMEFLLGAGLLFKRTQKISTILLILMHIIILIMLSPLGTNSDSIIWPWNIAMAVYLLVLVFRNVPDTIEVKPLFIGWNKLIVLLFGIMPIFNFFGYWDYYLSSSLYSCKPLTMGMIIPKKPSNTALLPYAVQAGGPNADTNFALINITSWSYKEMNVPVYPEMRVYKDIRAQLMKQYPEIGDSFFVYSYFTYKDIPLK